MRNSRAVAAVALMLVAVLSCAPGPNEFSDSPDDEGKVAGFWLGLWHGFIGLFTFVISLFSDSVHMYEVHNSGNWYNFGFLLGVMIFFGGSGSGTCGRKRR